MGMFNYVIAVMGIVLGAFMTVQINRLLQNRSTVTPTSPNYYESRASYGNGTSNKSPVYVLLRSEGEAPLHDLHREKAKLQSQLFEIEERIRRAVSKDEHASVSTPKNTSTEANTLGTTRETCPYNFKVYVYEIPHHIDALRISLEARRNKTLHVCHKCILEQFSLEYIMNDFFMHFCGRTHNPAEADYFYLPLVRDAEFRHAMSISTRNRAPSSAEWALLNILEKNDSTLWKSVFNVTDAYWHAHGGSDHIIAMPAPVTNIRHETSQRGFFHYMMHLHPPIFLCLEYSLAFVQEYPICATQKNIVVPYPTIDPELFGGKLLQHAATVERKYLLYYAGGLHGDCVEVRRAMKFIMQNHTALHNVIPPVRSNMALRENGFMAATFCPIPIGDSPSSKRMYDVLNFGCVPVVLSDDLVWAYSDQTGGPLNHTEFSIQIPQSVVHFTARKTLAR
jgi:antitoxin component HigA of HigAB toxin-antitoxin module